MVLNYKNMTSHSAVEACDREGHRFTIDLLFFFLHVSVPKNTTKGIETEIEPERLVRLQSAEANSVTCTKNECQKELDVICASVFHLIISENRSKCENCLTYYIISCTGGDSKTLMVVQVAPVEKNVAETVCSLNFAQRVRTVELGQATKRTIKS